MNSEHPPNQKQEQLIELFSGVITKETRVLPFLVSSLQPPKYFRHKTRYSFYRSESGEIAVQETVPHLFLVQSERANELVQWIAKYATEHDWELFSSDSQKGWLKHVVVREGKRTGEWMLQIFTTDLDIPESELFVHAMMDRFPDLTSVFQSTTHGRSNDIVRQKLLYGSSFIHEKIGRFCFRISPEAFFQTNASLVEVLYEAIKSSAHLQKSDILWDLYAGSATIGIYLSDMVKEVVAVESNASNCEDAVWAIEENECKNTTIASGTVEHFLTTSPNRPDLVVLDPPRAGLAPSVIDQIAQISPRQIILVSCNPTTCARDCESLHSRGYVAETIQGVDMFPYADEWETVIGLKNRI